MAFLKKTDAGTLSRAHFLSQNAFLMCPMIGPNFSVIVEILITSLMSPWRRDITLVREGRPVSLTHEVPSRKCRSGYPPFYQLHHDHGPPLPYCLDILTTQGHPSEVHTLGKIFAFDVDHLRGPELPKSWPLPKMSVRVPPFLSTPSCSWTPPVTLFGYFDYPRTPK